MNKLEIIFKDNDDIRHNLWKESKKAYNTRKPHMSESAHNRFEEKLEYFKPERIGDKVLLVGNSAYYIRRVVLSNKRVRSNTCMTTGVKRYSSRVLPFYFEKDGNNVWIGILPKFEFLKDSFLNQVIEDDIKFIDNLGVYLNLRTGYMPVNVAVKKYIDTAGENATDSSSYSQLETLENSYKVIFDNLTKCEKHLEYLEEHKEMLIQEGYKVAKLIREDKLKIDLLNEKKFELKDKIGELEEDNINLFGDIEEDYDCYSYNIKDYFL